MAKKVVSIEIGQQVTKVAVVDYLKKNPHVYTAFSFDTPPDVMEDGFVRDKLQMAQLLRAQMREHGVKEKEVVFSIASSRIASREVVFPFVSDSKLDELVHATAQDYFPVNIEEYTLAYMVQDTIKEDNKKSLKVSLLAAPDSLIQNYYSFAEELGVHIESLDYFGNGSMQVLSNHVVSGYCICVQMGTLSTMISVLSEGRQIMQRTISYGVGNIISSVLEQPDLNCTNEEAAMNLLCNENVLYSTLDYEDLEGMSSARMEDNQWKRSQQSAASRQAVTDSVGGIILNILRVIDYFHSKNPDVEMTALYLTGMGVKIRGIDLIFANEMGIPVQRLEKLTNVTFARSFAQGEQTEYIAVIGAAMAPIDFRLKSLVAKEAKKESMRVMHLVFAMAVVVSVVMVGISVLMYRQALNTQADLQSKKSALSSINAVYQENAMVAAQAAEAEVIGKSTTSVSNTLSKLITQLEDNLPSYVRVTFLQSSEEGLSITMKADKKITVARLLMNLEGIRYTEEGGVNLKYLDNLQVASITKDTENSSGGKKKTAYNFTLKADYSSELKERIISAGGMEADSEASSADAAAGTSESPAE